MPTRKIIKSKLKRKNIKIQKVFKRTNRVTLYNGDCLDLLRMMPDASVNLVVTSPPYCIGKEYEHTNEVEDFRQFHARLLPEIVRVTKEGGSICWQVGYHVKDGVLTPLDFYIYDYVSRNFRDLQLRNRIAWTFGHGLHCKTRFSGRHETILWFTKGDTYDFDLDAVRVKQKYPGKTHYKGAKKGKPSGNPKGKNPSDVWDSMPNVKAKHIEKTEHPCQFPIALAERFVLALTQEDDVVLDPFSGVGSTGCSALVHKRKFVGAELDRDYHKIASERLRQAASGKLKYRRHDQPILEPDPKSKVAKDPFRR